MAHFLSFELVSPFSSSCWICVKTDDVPIHWESVLQCLLELHSRSVQHARPKLVANPGSRGRTSRSVAETVSLTAQHMILQFYSDKTLGACAARLTLIVDGKLEPVKPWTWISSICSATPGAAPSAPGGLHLERGSSASTWSSLQHQHSEHQQARRARTHPWHRSKRFRSVCDEWIDDDQQVFVRPALFNSWFRAVDAARGTVGATRDMVGKGDVSSARPSCPPKRLFMPLFYDFGTRSRFHCSCQSCVLRSTPISSQLASRRSLAICRITYGGRPPMAYGIRTAQSIAILALPGCLPTLGLHRG